MKLNVDEKMSRHHMRTCACAYLHRQQPTLRTYLCRYYIPPSMECEGRGGWHRHTMAGFENSRPKTQAWNLAAILLQFQRFWDLVIDPQLFEPWRQEFLKINWKCSLKSENSCPNFGTGYPKNGHSEAQQYLGRIRKSVFYLGRRLTAIYLATGTTTARKCL